MWKHVKTQAEENECEQLKRARSRDNTFGTDDAKIPDQPKRASDPAPVTAGAAVPSQGATAGIEVPAAPDAGGDPGALSGTDINTQNGDGISDPTTLPQPEAMAAAKHRVFSYMPSMKDMNMQLPHVCGKLDRAGKRKLLDAGLYDPNREPEAKRWHGTHFLGRGATGSCTHWVLTDENENIIQVSIDCCCYPSLRPLISRTETRCERHWLNAPERVDQSNQMA